MKEAVNQPDHYNANPSGVPCIDIIEHLICNRANAIKYLWRAGEKDQTKEIQDLEKARWYVNREIQRLTFLESGDKKELITVKTVRATTHGEPDA